MEAIIHLLYLFTFIHLVGSLALSELNLAHLSRFDSSISSSSFGEPIFRLEPPPVINFPSSKGVVIPCLASGSPRPKISWFAGSSPVGLDTQSGSLAGEQMSPVTNVTNLRQIIQNGAAIRLFPFKESEYRQDIHSTEYRCVASNNLATIHSRSVSVQAGKSPVTKYIL